MQNNEPSLTSMRRMVLEIFYFKVNNLSKMDVTILYCRFLASFSLKYDVIDAILQDNEKMKVQYLRSLLFDLFEILQAVETWQRNFASFQIWLLWQLKSERLSVIKKQKVYCLNKCFSKYNLKQYISIVTAGSGDTLFLL